MKSRVLTVTSILLMSLRPCHLSDAQDHLLWLKIKENRVITNAAFIGFTGDSLSFSSGGRTFAVLLEEVEQVRVFGNSSFVRGGIVGAGIGVAAGSILSLALQSDRAATSVATTILLAGILGGIAGSVISSAEDSSTVITVGGMGKEEKKAAILELIHPHRQDTTAHTLHQ